MLPELSGYWVIRRHRGFELEVVLVVSDASCCFAQDNGRDY